MKPPDTPEAPEAAHFFYSPCEFGRWDTCPPLKICSCKKNTNENTALYSNDFNHRCHAQLRQSISPGCRISSRWKENLHNEVRQGAVEVLATEKEKMEVAEAIDHVQFDFDQTTIDPGFYTKLKGLAAWMKDKDVTLRVSGFADAIGTDLYNTRLSEMRARAVKAYLVGNGANPDLIDPVGFGEASPIAGNDSEFGRQKNRRVEFALY